MKQYISPEMKINAIDKTDVIDTSLGVCATYLDDFIFSLEDLLK